MERKIIDPRTIPGWGMDADPANDPTYPMKKYTGDDRKRSMWERPYLQSAKTEILKSTERPYLSAVFGTKIPPKGLSGALRRKAYKFSENKLRRWLLLIFADRVDSLGGQLADLFRLRIPLFTNDRGWRVLAKYKPGTFAWKIAQRLIVVGIIIALVIYFTREN
jgi:hypothetical protein